MPDPTLQATALRYAARDLTASEAAAFEARLANDQDARDALAEAVRLSAAAIGQRPPAPRPSLRALVSKTCFVAVTAVFPSTALVSSVSAELRSWR